MFEIILSTENDLVQHTDGQAEISKMSLGWNILVPHMLYGTNGNRMIGHQG